MAKDIKLSVEEMTEAGVQFGHKVSKLHPKMKQYVSGVKNGVHVFDLEKTGRLGDMRKIVEAPGFVQHFKKSPHHLFSKDNSEQIPSEYAW